MPILWILSLLAALVVLISLAAFVVSGSDESRGMAGLVAVVAGLAALVFGISSSANHVPIRSVGIVTSYSKPTGETTGSGLAWVKPWEKVGEWDASRQQYDFRGKRAVKVRTATLADAHVEGLIEWQVDPKNAPKQFMDYKGDFERFLDKRVHYALEKAIQDAFNDYNPLLNIDAKTGNLNVPLKPFSDAVLKNASELLKGDVFVHSATISRVNHDEKTESNIKAFQDKLATTRNLEQDRKNAEIQKQVTETNAKVDKQSRCLEIAEKVGANPGLCLNPGIVTGSK